MKQEEINQLSDTDLRNVIADSTEKIEKMKLSHAVTPMENPLQIKGLRKTIARLNTELTKREKQA